MELKESMEVEYEGSETLQDTTAIQEPISSSQIQKVISKAKNGKSPGIDHLPYEVFKNDNAAQMLHALFDKFFQYTRYLWESYNQPNPKESQ